MPLSEEVRSRSRAHLDALTNGPFTTFVLFQVFNVFNVRSEARSVFSAESLRNSRLWLAVVVVVVLQVVAVYVGVLRDLFKIDDLTAANWALAITVASSILWIEELCKLFARRRAPGVLVSATVVGAA